ncbi:MAG: 30S ribosomal protein S12 methylthiotransferase RimO [Candidatus Latescibacteria bacterium]|nr:30S ribosomal protein S12 methylthiotransferase RimO [Candidatus Latescibacterota bacterium]
MGAMQSCVSPKAALVTLGCPMNQVDSERIIGGLVSLGFEIVPEEEADIVVVNTCGFIEDAREESINTILSVAKLKETGTLKSLVVAGGLAERYRSDLESELTETDAVVGLKDRGRIPMLCRELLACGQTGKTGYHRVVTGPPHTAYLKIAEGCDNRCSYCAIPMIRGPYRSTPQAEILREAEELASAGVRELILIAQDTTNYGCDLDGCSLPGLLRRLSGIDAFKWIRLMYAHPAHFSDELIETIAALPHVIPYVDLPVQHISSKVLKRMGRATPPDSIYSLIDRLREKIEGVVLRTALIVGFPGETDEDFRELLDFISYVRFERLGAFVYSHEEGTSASALINSIPAKVARKRHETLMETQSQISAEFHHSLIGRELEMIIDTADDGNGVVIGRTYMDAPEIDGNLTGAGSVQEEDVFCRVRITGAGLYDLEGDIV